MNLEFSAPNLSELEQIVSSLIAEGKCACHIINPHKTRILMWKKVENNQATYHLRIGIQKFTSQEQTDRNGEIYWRYWSWEPKGERIPETNQPKLEPEKEIPTDPNPVTKYQQRIAKTEAINHANNSNSN